jgi:alpha-glucosidase
VQFADQFLHWRKQHPALLRGTLELVTSTDPVLAFERVWEGDRILCVFNLSNKEASVPIAERWQGLEGHEFQAKRVGTNLWLPAFGAGFFGSK